MIDLESSRRVPEPPFLALTLQGILVHSASDLSESIDGSLGHKFAAARQGGPIRMHRPESGNAQALPQNENTTVSIHPAQIRNQRDDSQAGGDCCTRPLS